MIPLEKFKDLSPLLLDKDLSIISTKQSKDEKWRFLTKPEDVPDLYLKMLIHFEDKRFYDHFGVDPFALARALFKAIKHRKIISGGSTLTMQVVRLLTPRKRTVFSKVLEIVEAVLLECRFSKNEILTFYLTLTPEGNNFEGIKAASFGYFKKDPKDLNLAQMALLVAIPQSPTKFRPNKYPENAKYARNKVLKRSFHILNEQDVKDAKNDPISSIKQTFPAYAPHFLEHFKNKAIIYSTLDGTLQRQTLNLIKTKHPLNQDAITLSILIVENASQKIRTYIGSFDYLNIEKKGYIDMIPAIRSPGSTLKPFIYAKALDQKIIDINTLIKDTKQYFKDYAPSNFEGSFHGDVTIEQALQQSLNIPAVILLNKIGVKQFLYDLESFVTMKFEKEGVAGLPIALGGLGISLYDLTSLYVGLANDGMFNPLLKEENAKNLSIHQRALMTKETALKIKKILQGAPPPVGFLPLFSIQSNPIAFKTGTSYGGRDALCIGYTKDFTVAVWIGRADGTAISSNIGRLNAAPIVFSIFTSLLPASSYVDEDVVLKMPLPKGTAKKIKNTIDQPFKIIIPQENAKILQSTKPIELKAFGKYTSLTWIVNGQTLSSNKWMPKIPGFYTISAIDERGISVCVDISVIE